MLVPRDSDPIPEAKGFLYDVWCFLLGRGRVTVELSRGRDFDLNEEGPCERGLCEHCIRSPLY